MPVYSLMEARIKQARAGKDKPLPIPLQFGVRLVYVILVTMVAIVVPFFGALMGLIGAIAVTPTTVGAWCFTSAATLCGRWQ